MRVRSSLTSVRPIRSPSTCATPVVGCSRPAARLSRVVLPAPLGPSTTQRSSSSTRQVRSCSRAVPERRTPTLSRLTTRSGSTGAAAGAVPAAPGIRSPVTRPSNHAARGAPHGRRPGNRVGHRVVDHHTRRTAHARPTYGAARMSAVIEIEGLRKTFHNAAPRQAGGGRRVRHAGRGGPDPRLPRPQRLRQDHHAARSARAGAGRRRPDDACWASRRRSCCPGWPAGSARSWRARSSSATSPGAARCGCWPAPVGCRSPGWTRRWSWWACATGATSG